MILVANADDLGISSERDKGIFECFTNGIVRSASLMVNGESCISALEHSLKIGLPIGLHLNLTEGRPIAAIEKVSTLVDSQGFLLGKHGIREALIAGRISLEQVQAEIEAQIEWFKHHANGLVPTHIDGHQHVHVLAGVSAVFAACAVAAGIFWTRVPREDLSQVDWIEPERAQFLQKVVSDSDAAMRVFADHSLHYPDAFIGLSLMGDDMTLERLQRALRITQQRQLTQTCEWMVHPGYRGTSGDDFNRSQAREHEMHLLCDANLPSLLSDFVTSFGFFSSLEKVTSAESAPSNASSSPIKEGTHRVMIVSSMIPFTGNCSTAERLAEGIRASGWHASCVGEAQFKSAADLQLVVDSEQPDLVLAVHAYRAGRLLDNLPIPFVLMLGGTDCNHDVADPIKGAVVRRVLSDAAAIISFSSEMMARCVVHCGDTVASKAHIIPQAVCVETNCRPWMKLALQLPSSSHLLLLPAGLRAVKHPQYLIAAARRLHAIDSRFVLVIIGPELDRECAADVVRMACATEDANTASWHESQVDAGNGCEAVRWSGDNAVRVMAPVSRPMLLAAMREAFVILNSSRSEGMSSAVLEGMALGATVVARAIPGNCGLLQHNISGLFFSSPEEFESIILKLAAEESGAALREKLGATAQKYVAKYHSIETERKNILKVLSEALRKHGASQKK